jgi:hypothetical protein
LSDPKGDSFFGGYLGRPQRDLDVLDALYAVGAEEWDFDEFAQSIAHYAAYVRTVFD